MLSDLCFRLRALFRPAASERDLDDELRFHREAFRERLQAEGQSAEDAARIVRIELGGISQVKDSSRDAWGLALVQGLSGDLRFSWRMLLRHRMFSAACILTLALGMARPAPSFPSSTPLCSVRSRTPTRSGSRT
jgi:hypothetical protein